MASTLSDIEIIRDAPIPTVSGELAADVWLPPCGKPAPALVMLLPYNKDWVAGAESARTSEYFARRGYASILVDFRGTGGSSGMARPPFSPEEADDGVAAVEWAAAQDWCDGNVGMWGVSYGAITALRTATRRPKPLRAIVPIVGHLDPERDFIHPSGRRGCLAPLAWALGNLELQLLPPRFDESGRWRRVWESRLESARPYLCDLVEHGPGDPVWRSREIDASRVDVPSFCIVGWRDLFVEGMLRAYEEIAAPKQLLAGPWPHALPDAAPFGAVDVLPLILRWWDRWLRGHETVVEDDPAVTVFIEGLEEWRGLEYWPPRQSTATELFGGLDGALVPASERIGVLEVALDATVGADVAFAYYQGLGENRPDEQGEDEARSLVFTSEPLTQPLTVMGRVRAFVDVTDEGSDETIVARLSDVTPDGRVVFVSSGIAPIAKPSGGTTVTLAPTAYRFKTGHHLRLLLAANDFPRLWPTASARLAVRCGNGGVTLDLPTVPDDVGSPVELSAADPRDAVSALAFEDAEASHDVTRSDQEASVRVKGRWGYLSPDRASQIWFHEEIHVSASPDIARFEGNASADVRGPAGTVRVEVAITATPVEARATGTVRVDGETVFFRNWTT